MPASAVVRDPEDIVLGVAVNTGPGAVCAICQLSQAARDFAASARQSGFGYSEIAAALSEGLSRPISQKSLWHHLNKTCKGTNR